MDKGRVGDAAVARLRIALEKAAAGDLDDAALDEAIADEAIADEAIDRVSS